MAYKNRLRYQQKQHCLPFAFVCLILGMYTQYVKTAFDLICCITETLFCRSVHREVRERGGELHQRGGKEDPHSDITTCPPVRMSGMFLYFTNHLKYSHETPLLFCLHEEKGWHLLI